MSDEFELPVVEETEIPELDEPEADESTADSDEKVETNEPKEEKQHEDDLPDGVKKRFSKMTAEKYRLKAIIDQQNAQLAQITEQLKSIAPSEEEVPDINAFVEQRAHEIVKQQDFNVKCNDTFSKWSKEFGDVSEAMEDLGSVGLQRDVLEAIVESDVSHKILQYLSNNLERAEKLSYLSPIKAARELDKIEQEVKALSAKKAGKVSNAPPPISGLGGKTSNETTADLSKPENYFEWLNKHSKKR